jgi:nitroimidazol reductase NimA-like FMN-containing flavoprotein (pyridoxamine 5'-phosphate oxidase superfamily)
MATLINMKTPARKSAKAPVFRNLTKKECTALLSRNHVGRIAYSLRGAVDIRPIHYVADSGWLFGRTSGGDKLMKLRHNQWVAFEVDEVEGPLDWRSIVARGTFYELHQEGSLHDQRLYDRALNAVRTMSRSALADDDPLPFRSVIFGVSIDSISGRSCSSKIKASGLE